MSYFFFFKQKTAYEMRISDWSSDVCSSDLREPRGNPADFTGDQFIAEDRDDARQRAHPAQAFAARAFAAPAHRLGPGEGADDRGDRFGQHIAGRAAGTPALGRASGRARVCQSVWISVVAVQLKKKKQTH